MFKDRQGKPIEMRMETYEKIYGKKEVFQMDKSHLSFGKRIKKKKGKKCWKKKNHT